MAISVLITQTSKEKNLALARILCIYYLLCMQKNINTIQVLLDLDSKVNTMILAYVLKLGFQICRTNIRAWKINSSIFETF